MYMTKWLVLWKTAFDKKEGKKGRGCYKIINPCGLHTCMTH
jgi:hypothetical protein